MTATRTSLTCPVVLSLPFFLFDFLRKRVVLHDSALLLPRLWHWILLFVIEHLDAIMSRITAPSNGSMDGCRCLSPAVFVDPPSDR